jgi:hypothetical protein
MARFEIDLGPSAVLDGKESAGLALKSGEGRFIAVQQSDVGVLLLELKKALEATALPTKVQRVNSLPSTFVSIGQNMSQASDGGFTPKPPGNWTPMKIFLGEGDGEGEVFLNLNPVLRKGEFSIKDADYGDIVLRQLARVL